MHLATLTRTDLTDAVVRELGLGRSDCAKLVERVLALACEALERGEEVKLSGFGVFEVRSKAARMGRNPKTGEPANIVPRRVMTFRASQLLKGRIAAGHAARAQRDAAPLRRSARG